jgi:hypothetical protein
MTWTLKVTLTPSAVPADEDLQGLDILDDYVLVEEGDSCHYSIDLGFVNDDEVEYIREEIHRALCERLGVRSNAITVEIDYDN